MIDYSFKSYKTQAESLSEQIQEGLLHYASDFEIISLQEAMDPVTFNEKRNKVAAAHVKKIVGVYGAAGHHNEDGKFEPRPATAEERKKSARETFDELDKDSDEDRNKKYAEASKRQKAAGIGSKLKDTTKTDTAANVVSHGAENGHLSAGMGGAPSSARFHLDHSGNNYKECNTCPGKTTECAGTKDTKGTCLAMAGHGGQATIQGHRDAITQSSMHNGAAMRDHHIMLHKELSSMAKKAKKEGKGALVRPDVSTGGQHEELQDAVGKSFGPKSARVKSGTHAPITLSDYGKNPKNAHDPENGIHNTHSDTGRQIDDNGHSTGAANRTLRARHWKNVMHDGQSTYMVFNRNRPSESDGADSKSRKEYEGFMSKMKAVKRVESVHSEPNEHEVAYAKASGQDPKNYQHHEEGWGRVSGKDGKSYRTQLQSVSKKHKLVDGSEVYPGDTDARHIDEPQVKYKSHPDETGKQKTVGPVTPAFATSATSKDSLKSSFFHDVKSVKNGVYHEPHPDEVEAADKKRRSEQGVATVPISKIGGRHNSVKESVLERVLAKRKE